VNVLLAVAGSGAVFAGTAFGVQRLGAEEDVAMIFSGGIGALCGWLAFVLGGMPD